MTTEETKETAIAIVKRYGVYTAFDQNRPEVLGTGMTPMDALGAYTIRVQSELGLRVEFWLPEDDVGTTLPSASTKHLERSATETQKLSVEEIAFLPCRLK